MSDCRPRLDAVRANYAANRNREDGIPIKNGMDEFDRWVYPLLAKVIRDEAVAIESSDKDLPGMTVGDAVRGLRRAALAWERVVDDLIPCCDERCIRVPNDEQKELEVVIGLNAGKFTRGVASVRELTKILYENDVRVVPRGGGFSA